jgi:hypothetical protein
VSGGAMVKGVEDAEREYGTDGNNGKNGKRLERP